MPDSLQEQSVRDVLLQARTPRTKQVMVDGSPVTIPTPFPSPEDWRDKIIYFLMIDRFNNPNAVPKHQPFDQPIAAFQGGTFKGIQVQLAYLKNLGTGAIWITPPFKNKQRLDGQINEGTYHGYGIQHFLEVDPNFGTESDLIELVDEAHARGLYVIFDIVINHGGDVFSYVGHGSVAPFSPNPYDLIEWRDGNGNARSEWRVAPDQVINHPDFNDDSAVLPVELLDNDYWRRQGSRLEGTEGDFLSLKELRTDFSQTTAERGFEFTVRNALISIYQYVIARFDVDGFRIDTLKHVERDFARVFGNAMREFALSIGKKNFFTFGEVFGSEEEIARYTGRFADDPDDLVGVDACLDFPLSFTLPPVVKGLPGNPPTNLMNLYEQRKNLQRGGLGHGAVISSHGEASRFFTTFLENHDRHERFHFLPTANPNQFDDQVSMGYGCLFALLGIPIVYFGAEQELGTRQGSPDTDLVVREALWGKPGNPFDQNNPFYRAIRDLAQVRASQPALRYGRLYFRQTAVNTNEFRVSPTAPGIIAFSRILNDMEVITLANPFNEATLSGSAIVDFSLHPDGSTLSLLYSNKGASATPPGPIATRAQGTVIIQEIGGGTTGGPCRVVPFTLQPMEIHILGRPFP
jgi:glycosidase